MIYMPLYSRAITVSYYNYYLKKPCVLDLTYTLQKGFESLDEAKEIISKKWNPEHFTYILVDQQIYAVAMELIGNQIVLTKEVCFYRYNRIDNYCDFKDYQIIPTMIKKPRISRRWNDIVAKDIKKLFSVEILQGPGSSYVRDNSVVLLACVLFDTMIPVYELNAADRFFDDYPPSMQKLWKNGVKSYNPFTKKIEYALKGVPYELAEYTDTL